MTWKAFRSPARAISHLRRELEVARERAKEADLEVYKLIARAEEAEREVVEWKRRFDRVIELVGRPR